MKKLLFTIAVLFSSLLVLGKDSKSQAPESYYFNRGHEAWEAEQYDKALEYFNKDINENPKSYGSYIFIAGIRLANEEYGKALAACDAGLKYAPKKDKPSRALLLGLRTQTYLALNDTVRALDDLSNAIKLDGKYDYFDERAQLYFELREYDLSDADYNALLKIRPGDARLYVALGRNQSGRGNFDEAIKLGN